MGLVLAVGSGMGTSLVFRDQNFVPSSDIGSVYSGRVGLGTYEAKSDFTALAYNSQLRGVITILVQIRYLRKMWGL